MKFTVNLNAGVVIARYVDKDNRGYWADVLGKTLDNVDVDDLLGRWERYEIVDKVINSTVCFSGKARLYPTDVFDVEVGKRVAVRDLNRRFDKAKTRVLKEFEKVLQRRYEDTMERSRKRWL
jgi:hypothetical protein|nr:MAG TPA: hypothetical protein [Inoviridae sp.]